MIKGLDKFRDHFSAFKDHYVLIGGTASVLVMEEAGVDFRATKDLDIVLCLEVLDTSFAKAFWAFVKAGGYQNQQKSTGKNIYYRFTKPQKDDYPFMLELFSRVPDTLVLGDDSELTPIPINDDVSSLSAILLDEDYYQFLHQYKTEVNGVQIITELCIIPLKAKAWLDLSQRRESGERVDSRTIKKHKNDIFRLFQILSPTAQVDLPGSVLRDMQLYLTAISEEKNLDLKPYGLKGLGVLDVASRLRQIYGIPE